MKEKEILRSINNILNNSYLGDDCAYLEDIGIVVSHDSLVEDVHFSQKYATPYELGYKSIMVNLSDIAASGAEPAYLTVALSLPKNISIDFVESFYQGAKRACGNDAKIVGGDITGSEKIIISVCAIGKTLNRSISSRNNARVGQKVVVSGVHGSSAAGLRLLECSNSSPKKLLQAHLMPVAQLDFSRKISENHLTPYAMMDSSDGLADALSQIAQKSGVNIKINFDNVPIDKEIKIFEDWKNLVLFGGEDYQLIACVDESFDFGEKIGEVCQGDGLSIDFGDRVVNFSNRDVENNIYNHFKGCIL